MVEYEWGSPSHVLLHSSTGEEEGEPSTPTLSFPASHPLSFYHHHPFQSQAFSYPPPPPPMMSTSLDPAGFLTIPKPEPFYIESHPGSGGMGLNLGLGTGRTNFDDDFVNRLYGRSSTVAVNPPRCQAEACNADLTHSKHYHRRHKVCEFHSKASTVVTAGFTQRFCQQCSRFHLLAEFDNGKRSCRRRLADHNRRRRKSNQQPASEQDRRHSQNSDNPPSRSPSDSDAVMVADSPVDSGRMHSCYDSSSAASSSVSTPPSTSVFY